MKKEGLSSEEIQRRTAGEGTSEGALEREREIEGKKVFSLLNEVTGWTLTTLLQSSLKVPEKQGRLCFARCEGICKLMMRRQETDEGS
ncbi:hypothetical protein MHYP_G00010860 [Metynnis hypsauchen]